MKNKKSNKLLKTAMPLALVLVAAAGIVWLLNRQPDANTSRQPASSNVSPDGINYGPPTEQDKQEAEENKQNLAEKEEQSANTPPSQQVTPVITRAEVYPGNGNIEAAGYIPGVFEDGGTCKYTFSLGASQVIRETGGFKNVNTTNCPAVEIPRSEFPSAGAWKLVLSYSSSTVSGNSGEQIVQIN